jgi:hypothetical protein
MIWRLASSDRRTKGGGSGGRRQPPAPPKGPLFTTSSPWKTDDTTVRATRVEARAQRRPRCHRWSYFAASPPPLPRDHLPAMIFIYCVSYLGVIGSSSLCECGCSLSLQLSERWRLLSIVPQLIGCINTKDLSSSHTFDYTDVYSPSSCMLT